MTTCWWAYPRVVIVLSRPLGASSDIPGDDALKIILEASLSIPYCLLALLACPSHFLIASTAVPCLLDLNKVSMYLVKASVSYKNPWCLLVSSRVAIPLNPLSGPEKDRSTLVLNYLLTKESSFSLTPFSIQTTSSLCKQRRLIGELHKFPRSIFFFVHPLFQVMVGLPKFCNAKDLHHHGTKIFDTIQ